ncbi:hypothetical protein Cycma_2453 [Cyclobacterium marinum DSM 745]|uniref:Uncharacterized protein n=1 Tax=Cyclobacterium marinum (strain ATCC 25205 / DSM 745 / LMG 13164 / NCIMB 1802) TaxID=880070 RepID=G0IUX1_CYCMS|nr:hypothetical protein Cycma_2453 [Cyclobacterium marinum DSM 745]
MAYPSNVKKKEIPVLISLSYGWNYAYEPFL